MSRNASALNGAGGLLVGEPVRGHARKGGNVREPCPATGGFPHELRPFVMLQAEVWILDFRN